MYDCSQCSFCGCRESVENHFLIRHVRPSLVPYRCSLCGFRSMSERLLNTHVSMNMHKNALRRNPKDSAVFMKSQCPYSVEVGRDILLCSEDRPRYFSSRSSGINQRISPRSREHEPAYSTGEYNSEGRGKALVWGRGASSGRPARKRTRFDAQNTTSYWKNTHGVDVMEVGVSGDKDGREGNSTKDLHGDKTSHKADDTSTMFHGINSAAVIDELIDEARQTHRISLVGLNSNDHSSDIANSNHKSDLHPEKSSQSKYIWGHQSEDKQIVTQSADSTPSEQETSIKTVVEPSTEIQSLNVQTSPANAEADKNSKGTGLHSSRESPDDAVERDDEEEFDQEGLEEKVSDLIQSLEPLKNISKALIALDHHLRRIIPILEAVVPLPAPADSTSDPSSVPAKQKRCPNRDPRRRR